jgi:integrase
VLGVFVHLAAATGARRGELLGLRWGDLHLEQGVMVISPSFVVGIAGVVEKDTKAHAARGASLGCGLRLNDEMLVFSRSPDGTVPWRPEYATQAFSRVADLAGLPHVRRHDLRQFVASRLLANGIDVRTVAGRLGHRNPNVTLNVSAQFLPEADRGAADVLRAALARPGPGWGSGALNSEARDISRSLSPRRGLDRTDWSASSADAPPLRCGLSSENQQDRLAARLTAVR